MASALTVRDGASGAPACDGGGSFVRKMASSAHFPPEPWCAVAWHLRARCAMGRPGYLLVLAVLVAVIVADWTVAMIGGTTFLALAGAKLPPPGNAWPLGGGFHPTDLTADFHAHRERWAFLHTQLRPSMPAAEMGKKIAMVGTFLMGNKAVVWLNGVKLTIKCGGAQPALAGCR